MSFRLTTADYVFIMSYETCLIISLLDVYKIEDFYEILSHYEC